MVAKKKDKNYGYERRVIAAIVTEKVDAVVTDKYGLEWDITTLIYANGFTNTVLKPHNGS